MASSCFVLLVVLFASQRFLHSKDAAKEEQSCLQYLAETKTEAIFLSFLTQTNLEDSRKAKTTRSIVFYYNLIMYVVILSTIVCICHTDPEFVQILGPNINWSELEIVKEKFYLHLAVGITFGFGFLSLAIDILLVCCRKNSVFQGIQVFQVPPVRIMVEINVPNDVLFIDE